MNKGYNPNYQPDNGYTVSLSLAPARGRGRDRYRVRLFWLDPHNFNAMGVTHYEEFYTSQTTAERTAKQLAKDYNATLQLNF